METIVALYSYPVKIRLGKKHYYLFSTTSSHSLTSLLKEQPCSCSRAFSLSPKNRAIRQLEHHHHHLLVHTRKCAHLLATYFPFQLVPKTSRLLLQSYQSVSHCVSPASNSSLTGSAAQDTVLQLISHNQLRSFHSSLSLPRIFLPQQVIIYGLDSAVP